MAVTAERLAIMITANAGNAIAEFKKVGAAAQGLQGSVAGGTKSMGGLGQAGLAAGGMLKAGLVGGAVAAGTALVAFAAHAVGDVAKLAASIRDVQRVTGGTSEEASKLVAILDDFEVPVETLNKGFFRLAREIGRNDDAFAKAGFSVARNVQGNVDMSATLLNIADAYNATEDPAKRATLLTAAFGRGGAELIPILEQGRAGIEAVFAEAEHVGQIFSQSELDDAEKYRLAIDDLHDATQQFSLMAGKVLVPVITDIANAATGAIGAMEKLAGAAGKLGDVKVAGTNVKGIFDKFTDFAIPGKLVVGTILDLTRSSPGAADGLGDIGEAAAQAAIDADAAAKELDALTKTVFSAQDAFRAFESAKESLSDAETSLANATADYNKLLKDGAVDEKKVADARRSLAEATRSAADADRGLVKAQKEYDAALANANDLHGFDTAQEVLADKAEGLADAKDTVASAHEREAEAARDLKEAQAGDPDFQKKLAAAKESLSDATTRVADATRDLGKQSYENEAAQRAEAAAIGANADEVLRLRSELEALLKLHPEMFSFLSPIINALSGGSLSPVSAPVEAAAPDFGNFPSGSAFTAPSLSGGLLNSLSPVTTTNNVTVNVASPYVDPVGIAKNVVWELN
jgi:hypothetical protein